MEGIKKPVSLDSYFFPRQMFCLKDSTFSYLVNKHSSIVVRSQALEFKIMALLLANYRPWAS